MTAATQRVMAKAIHEREQLKRRLLGRRLRADAIQRGRLRASIIALPRRPSPRAAIYLMAAKLGTTFTRNPRAPASAVIAWSDVTFREDDRRLRELAHRRPVINLQCADISKSTVATAFREVFRYDLSVDPAVHRGPAVMKPERNAAHAGHVVTCPVDSRDGYTYQRLVNNLVDGETIEDIRIPVIGQELPLAYRKYRPLKTRFSNTNTNVVLTEPASVASELELGLLLDLARRLGLDYGELDCLRDREDGRLYVVDVNNTPYGPPNHLPAESCLEALDLMTDAFERQFLRAEP